MNGHDTIPVSRLPPASELDGGELVPIVQAGDTRRTTTLAIAALADRVFSGAGLFVAGFSVPTLGTADSITFTTVVEDTDGYIVGGNLDQFVAPFDGWYLLTASLYWSGNSTGYRTVDFYNDVGSMVSDAVAVWSGFTVGWSQALAWRTFFTVAGTPFSCVVSQNSGSTLTLNAAFGVQFLGGERPSPPPATLLLDTFTAANGTPLPIHAPEIGPTGDNADIGGGTAAFEIQANQATSPTTGGGPYGFAWELAESDVSMSLTTTLGATGTAISGILLRWTTAANYWVARIRHDIQTLELREVAVGSETIRATASLGSSLGETFEMTVVANSDTITVTVDAVTIQYTSASFNQSATLHGLHVYQAASYSQDSFDRIEVVPLP